MSSYPFFFVYKKASFYLEKGLGHKYTSEEIIKNFRDYKFLKAKDFGYIPAYTRTQFTDDLHKSFGFRTDYEILS